MPPTSGDGDDEQRGRPAGRSAGRCGPASCASSSVSSGKADDADGPAALATTDRSGGAGASPAVPGCASSSSAALVEMTWTSMSPDAPDHRVDRPSPGSARHQRDRGVAPSTIWVACSARAKSDQGGGDVVADDLVVRAAEVVEQCAVRVEQLAGAARPGRRSAATCTPRRSPCGRAAMRAARRISVLAAGRAGDGDDDPLAGLPGVVDAVGVQVVLQGLVDLVGEPQQGQLAQRGEVADPEVVAERGVDLLGRRRCCRGPSAGAAPRASCPPARPGRRRGRRRRARVSRCVTPVMRSTTSFSDSRCWMLTVEMTSMPASSSSSTSCQRFSLREPGTFVWASSSTRATVGRRARTASTSISSNVGAAVARGVRRGTPRGRGAGPRCSGRPWVSTKPTTTSVPRCAPAPALVEHGEGLAHAGRRTEVDAQVAPCHGAERTAGAGDRVWRRLAGLVVAGCAAKLCSPSLEPVARATNPAKRQVRRSQGGSEAGDLCPE